MIKGIIFDLDGTTANTLQDIKDSLNKTLVEYGFKEKNSEEVRLNLGKGSLKLISDSLPENTDEKLISEILNSYLENYSKNYLVKTTAYQGINDLLKTLQNKNILLAINSNKPDHLTKAIIKQLYPEISFIEILGNVDDIPRKPDPAGAEMIIEKMGLDKNEVLYIGDSETDIQTAHNANLKVIGCLWGFRDLQTLQENNATYIVSKPEEILKYLGG